MERDRFLAVTDFAGPVEVIGFGLVESIIHLGNLLRQTSCQRVTLIGLAGTFDPDVAAVGSAHEVGWATIDGIGVGNHQDQVFVAAPLLGWPGNDTVRVDSAPADALGVVSVAAASGGPLEAAQRRRRCGDVAIEDMESYGVIKVCQAANVAVRVIRGVCNIVGNRDHSTWKIDDAMRSIAERI